MKLQEVSEATLKLENLFRNSESGKEFSYKELESITGLLMNTNGKNYMRSALRRLKLPYETNKGIGIRLLIRDNAMRIITHRVIKVDNAVKRAEKTTKQVSRRVYDELNEVEKRTINILSASFGTIRAVSLGAKKIFNKELQLVENNKS